MLVTTPEPPRETQLVPVRVTQVEVTLAPRGIARREERAKPGCGRTRVHSVDIRHVENHPPPTPLSVIERHLLQVEVLSAYLVARERRLSAAVETPQPEDLVERRRGSHVTHRQRDRADRLEPMLRRCVAHSKQTTRSRSTSAPTAPTDGAPEPRARAYGEYRHHHARHDERRHAVCRWRVARPADASLPAMISTSVQPTERRPVTIDRYEECSGRRALRRVRSRGARWGRCDATC